MRKHARLRPRRQRAGADRVERRGNRAVQPAEIQKRTGARPGQRLRAQERVRAAGYLCAAAHERKGEIEILRLPGAHAGAAAAGNGDFRLSPRFRGFLKSLAAGAGGVQREIGILRRTANARIAHGSLARSRRLHKQRLKRRMRVHGVFVSQRYREALRACDFRVAQGANAHANVHSARFRRDARADFIAAPAAAPEERRESRLEYAFGKRDFAVVVLHARKQPFGIARRVAVPAVGIDAQSAIEAVSVRVQPRARVLPEQQVPLPGAGKRRARRAAQKPAGAGAFLRCRRVRNRPAEQRRAGERLLVQQHGKGALPRRTHEILIQAAARQRVAQRAQRHALMVRHIAEHHAALVFAALVQRFIIAKLPAQPLRGHLLKVLRGAFRRGGKRQHARVRRDHAALVRAGQRQLGNAEGAILIVHRRVKRAVGALGYAPRPAPPLAVSNLRADRAAGAHAQQRLCGGGHEQEGHHILEHRAAPRIQRAAAAHPRARTTQFFPMAHGNAALGHRHIGQDARFGRQQVVMRLPRCILLRVVADAEQPALLVVQAFQLHFVDQRLEPPRVLLRRGGARHKQRGEQVSAVHAGNVGRAQRIQRARVVPVIQKPVPLGQRMQRAQRFPKPRAHLARVDQPQLARRHAAHQIHADVRG